MNEKTEQVSGGLAIILMLALLTFATGCDEMLEPEQELQYQQIECPDCPNGECPNVTSAIDFCAVPFCRVEGRTPGQSKMQLCSGTIVDNTGDYGLVLTCCHCTTNSTKFSVTFADGQKYDAILVAVDRSNDLAALVIQSPRVLAVPIGAFEASGVYRAYGFGGNGKLASIAGRVVRSVLKDGHTFTVIDAEPINGDSGAGTLNERNEFVGVLWGRNDEAAVEGLITMGQPVTHFLRELVDDGKWLPSSEFTPGGQALHVETSSLQECQLFGRSKGPSHHLPRRIDVCPGGDCTPRIDPRTPAPPKSDGGGQGREPVDPRDLVPRVVQAPKANLLAKFAEPIGAGVFIGLLGTVLLYFRSGD